MGPALDSASTGEPDTSFEALPPSGSSDVSMDQLALLPVSTMPSLITALPTDAVVRVLKSLEHVKLEAETIVQKFEQDAEYSGNQFLVLLKLHPQMAERLFNDHHCLEGIDYRFEFEDDTGVLRLVPGYQHEYTTNGLFQKINRQLDCMGLDECYRWGGATRYRSTGRGKEGDQVFSPAQRWPSGNGLSWPTVVIETGFSESRPKLVQDARWWFGSSNGQVQIVILISITKHAVHIERWQLAPPDAPNPLTRSYINALRNDPINVPPSTPQSLNVQQPYSCAEIDVTANNVVGAPSYHTILCTLRRPLPSTQHA
ncbi:hypothetical protein N7519_004666 [Penicillium mononematosum]|uniref:uncharacterized protein n=1 Tax=Penicillium mononematosum TaxID=268346 RepID=UPI0025471D1E|nr:uncharacterized protein N7519_004666 [Penicillium mononematosum]KAJ6189758.1 hypothetical protein N7519_004666 [Penicillium mononematosum]